MALIFSTRQAEYSSCARSVLMFALNGREGIAFGIDQSALRHLERRPRSLTPLQQERAAKRHRERLEAAAAAAFAEGRQRGQRYCIWIGPEDV